MHICDGLTYAIIPARSGSTSIKDKNIRPIAGHPLMAYSIIAAKLCNNIDRVIVTTDSEKYAKIANKYGAETPYLRPNEISGKYSTDLEFMNHAIYWFEENEERLPEYWVHLRPTSPLRNPIIMDEAIKKFKLSTADCLRSVHLTDACPYKWFNMTDNGYLKTVCNISLDDANGPRQSYPPVYIPNGYIDIIKTKQILKTNTLYGTRALSFETIETIDIDYEKDLKQIQAQIHKYMGPVSNELKKYK